MICNAKNIGQAKKAKTAHLKATYEEIMIVLSFAILATKMIIVIGGHDQCHVVEANPNKETKHCVTHALLHSLELV